MFNNLFLTAACATVFVGTLYPLALEALTGEKISVGAPFFNLTFGPLFVPLLLAVPFGPLLAWKRGDLLGAAQRLIGAAGAGARRRSRRPSRVDGGGPVLAPFGIGLAVFVMAGALDRSRRAHRPVARAASRRRCARARGLPRSAWGTALAHFGARRDAARHRLRSHLGHRAHRRRSSRTRPSRSRGYDLTFDGLVARQGPNYRELIAQVHRAAAAAT